MTTARKLREYATAVNQLTAALKSSSSLAAGNAQLARRRRAAAAAGAALPYEYPAIGRYEQDGLKAAVGILTAMADERHVRDQDWMKLLTDHLVSGGRLLLEPKAEPWLQQHGARPTAQPLLPATAPPCMHAATAASRRAGADLTSWHVLPVPLRDLQRQRCSARC
jgi:hypothetical protein